MHTWDPTQYARFASERSRPFFDLLARVPDGDVRCVADLGCGTGQLTRTLAERWPLAQVYGIDTSSEMLAEVPAHPALRFECADLRSWSPPQPVDRLISNAVLQWLPDHASLLDHMLSMLSAAGVLAVQVPHNGDSPAMCAISELMQSRTWRASLGDVRLPGIESSRWYAERLAKLGLHVDLWETVYWHRMQSARDILDWLCGSVLRPVMAKLEADRWAVFRDALLRRLEAAHPAHAATTGWPFRRLFFVAATEPLHRT